MSLVNLLREYWPRPAKSLAVATEASAVFAQYKLLVTHLARYAHVLEPSLPKDSEGRVDPVAMAFEQGRKDLFLHLAQLASVSADDLEDLLSDFDDEIRNGEEL